MLVINKAKEITLIIVASVSAAQAEDYVYCTHGLRKIDDGKMTAYYQAALFRLSDLKFKTEKDWQYQIPCEQDSCEVSTSENSVLLHKKLTEGHEIYLTKFDQPNMEIVVDRTRVTHSGKRTAYIEFQCEWFD
ncbi:MAG: hypothetical protein EBT51_09820 [Flavobacteriaceae bacterium]|jgi:hypothetical protein|nr:hypothetical protein [Flavobacteriaceae bacterium]